MNENIPRCVLEVESILTGEYVRVTLWHEKASLADIICKLLLYFNFLTLVLIIEDRIY